MPILCPALINEYAVEGESLKHKCQGAVSLSDCLKCEHNKGQFKNGEEISIRCTYGRSIAQVIVWMPI